MKNELKTEGFINSEINNSKAIVCPCPMKKCSNHGKCEVCKKCHLGKNELPFCKRKHGFFTKLFFRKSYKMAQEMQRTGSLP